jgi:FkbM family methyltransferase
MIVGYEDYKHNYDFSDVRGVIHVGAHHGQEHEAYLAEFGEDLQTHWFEPGIETFSVLKENLGGSSRTELYNFALGSESGELPLWTETANKGQSSSLARPVKHLELFPHIEFSVGDAVSVRTLDSFDITNSNMMVLDVQGYELEVLKGAVETLSKVDHIFCEVNDIAMYEGCPNLQSLCEFLHPLGFELKEIWWTDGNWGDGYWRRRRDI